MGFNPSAAGTYCFDSSPIGFEGKRILRIGSAKFAPAAALQTPIPVLL